MGFHGFANTELVLELSLNSISSMPENTTNPTKKHTPSSDDHPLVPSLTLALSSDSRARCGGSSFSNASVKREREVASEESGRGMENVSGEDGEEDEDGGVNGRKKLRLTKAQSGLLEEAFKIHTTLNPVSFLSYQLLRTYTFRANDLCYQHRSSCVQPWVRLHVDHKKKL